MLPDQAHQTIFPFYSCDSSFEVCKLVHHLYHSGKDFERLEEKQLMQWENVIADTYLSSTEKAERNTIAGRVKSSMEK